MKFYSILSLITLFLALTAYGVKKSISNSFSQFNKTTLINAEVLTQDESGDLPTIPCVPCTGHKCYFLAKDFNGNLKFSSLDDAVPPEYAC